MSEADQAKSAGDVAVSNNISNEMDACLRARDYQGAADIGEKFLLQEIDPKSSQAAYQRFVCISKLAEAKYGLRLFEESLEKYEEARLLAGSYVDVCSEDAMDLLFKIERTLNSLAMADKIGAVDAELKNVLVSQYLMQSDNFGAESKTAQNVSAKELDDLWSNALDSLEIQPGEDNKTGLMEKAEELLRNRAVQATLHQVLIWCSGIFAICLLVHSVMYVLSNPNLEGTALAPSALRTAYERATKSDTKTPLLALKSDDGSELIVQPNGVARLSTQKGSKKGHFIFYDGSLLSALQSIFHSQTSSTFALQCSGSSIVSQTGIIFFDPHASDFWLVIEMNHVAQKVAQYLTAQMTLPEPIDPLMTYLNQTSKHRQKIVITSESESRKGKPGAGTIILIKSPDSPRDFQLVGYCNAGQPLAAFRAANGWRPMYPTVEPSAAAKNAEVLFIFCEKPFNPLIEFLRTRMLIVLSGLLVLCACGLVAVKILLGQTKRNSSRRIKKPKPE